MSALKRKNILFESDLNKPQDNALFGIVGQTEQGAEKGAAQLAQSILEMPRSADIIYLKTESLSKSPAAWNFYEPLPEDKMLELIHSITENGLFHAIVVWDRGEEAEEGAFEELNTIRLNFDNSSAAITEKAVTDGEEVLGRYIILSGHNRVRAYSKLYEKTKDDIYLSIPCVIKRDIDTNTAKQIIIDSNFISRTLSAKEKVKSIHRKYVMLGNNTDAYQKIAEDYDLSIRQIQRYLSLTKLRLEFLNLLDLNKISMRSALILTKFSDEIQRKISDDFVRDKENSYYLKNKNIAKLSSDMEYDEIKETLMLEEVEHNFIELKVSIPATKKDELMKYIETLCLAND